MYPIYFQRSNASILSHMMESAFPNSENKLLGLESDETLRLCRYHIIENAG